MQNEYIVTIELWKDGKSQSWQQVAIDCGKDTKASELLSKIQQTFGNEGHIVKVVAMFKL